MKTHSNREPHTTKKGPGRKHSEGPFSNTGKKIKPRVKGARAAWKYQDRYSHALTHIVTERNLRSIEQRKS